MQHVGDYEGILMAVQQGSTKAKQLAAQLIPKFFKFFPGLASKAASAHFDLLEEEELGVISGAPLYFVAFYVSILDNEYLSSLVFGGILPAFCCWKATSLSFPPF